MKQFLIVGSLNVISYKEVFPYIKSRVVKYRPNRIHKFENGAAAATWYTTLIPPYIPPLVLTKSYNPDDYPKYDNYDAINVDKTKDIPCDYDGVMGVPITFLDKYCPEQFEIVGLIASAGYLPNLVNIPMTWNRREACPYVNGKKVYARILIRHRK